MSSCCVRALERIGAVARLAVNRGGPSRAVHAWGARRLKNPTTSLAEICPGQDPGLLSAIVRLRRSSPVGSPQCLESAETLPGPRQEFPESRPEKRYPRGTGPPPLLQLSIRDRPAPFWGGGAEGGCKKQHKMCAYGTGGNIGFSGSDRLNSRVGKSPQPSPRQAETSLIISLRR